MVCYGQECSSQYLRSYWKIENILNITNRCVVKLHPLEGVVSKNRQYEEITNSEIALENNLDSNILEAQH